MAMYMHPGILDYFNMTLSTPLPADPSRDLTEHDCAATMVAFLPNHGVDGLLNAWLDCALDKACIAPEGSDRLNHRQDQSALTMLTATLRREDVVSELDDEDGTGGSLVEAEVDPQRQGDGEEDDGGAAALLSTKSTPSLWSQSCLDGPSALGSKYGIYYHRFDQYVQCSILCQR